MNKTEKLINEFLKEYFKLLEIDVDITVSSDNETILVKIVSKGDSAGLLIGNKGKNLFALQSIINCIVKKSDKEARVLVDIDGWREKESDRLEELADKTAQKAIESNEAQSLYNLTPSQRKIVHTHLSFNGKVKTESFGEGENRYLTVSPK